MGGEHRLRLVASFYGDQQQQRERERDQKKKKCQNVKWSIQEREKKPGDRIKEVILPSTNQPQKKKPTYLDRADARVSDAKGGG